MFNYLRTIGFSNIKDKSQIDNLLGVVMTTPDKRVEKHISNNEKIVEMFKMFSKNFGIVVRGYYDNKSFFHVEHYCPIIMNRNISMNEELYFNKKLDSISYVCLCDDARLGVALIFYLQNVVDYMRSYDMLESDTIAFPITLSGLCNDGKIILPIVSNNKIGKKRKISDDEKRKLYNDAIKGNKEALDKIVLNNIDMHKRVLQRIKKEDVYTVVENTFYPYGNKQDCYSIIGTIREINKDVNIMTNEDVYILLVECKNVLINICINKKDLLGMPSIGSRFKGNIWLQGYVDFNNV